MASNPPKRTARYSMPWPQNGSRPDGAEMLNEIGRVASLNGSRLSAAITAYDRRLDELELALPVDPWTPFQPVWSAQGSSIGIDYDLNGSAVLDCSYVRYGPTTMIMKFDYTFSSTSADSVALLDGMLTWTVPALARGISFRGGKTLPAGQNSIISGLTVGTGFVLLGSTYHQCFVRFASALNRVCLWQVRVDDSAVPVLGTLGFSSGDRIAFDLDYETASRGA